MNAQVQCNYLWRLAGTFFFLIVAGAAGVLWEPARAASQELSGNFGHGSAAFSPDGKRLATINGTSQGYSNLIKIWDITTGKDLFTVKGHTRPLKQLRFSPDGNYLLSFSLDKTVTVWDSATFNAVRSLGPHQDDVQQIEFSPDGERLYVLSSNQSLRDRRCELKCWSVSSGKEVFALREPGGLSDILLSHDGKVLVASYQLRPDQILPVQPGLVRIWDAATGVELRTIKLTSHPRFIALSPAGDRLALVDDPLTREVDNVPDKIEDPSLQIWSISDGKLISSVSFKRNDNDYRVVAYSPDGKLLAVKGNLTIKVWDTASNQFTYNLKSQISIHGIMFSPDSMTLAAGCGNYNEIFGSKGDVKIWDLKNGKLRQSFSGQRGYVQRVVFSPDGKQLLSINDVSVRLWNLKP